MIDVKCDSCGAIVGMADAAAGKTLKCPNCRQPLSVPSPADSRAVIERLDRLIVLLTECRGYLRTIYVILAWPVYLLLALAVGLVASRVLYGP